MLQRLSDLAAGRLFVLEGHQRYEFGKGDAEQAAVITVHDRRVYRDLALGGDIGAAEAYLRGYWDSSDLTRAMQSLARISEPLSGIEWTLGAPMNRMRLAMHWVHRNTRAGSQRNIAAHYDLSNEFFGLMLDRTMTYSSGLFPTSESTLEEASFEKYDLICRKLQLQPRDHVLEIGAGWGGFAEHAARNYGCSVTTTTISQKQYEFARRRLDVASLRDRVTVLNKDYRDLTGRFNKLVSIEMVEAVGEKYLPTYFKKCAELLEADGMMLLQAIVSPDHRYDRYRKSADFIQHYVFPGGFLPSLGAIAHCLRAKADLRISHVEEFGSHYARTLSHWRRNFWRNINAVRQLGFDQRFIRLWNYYLCYCEAAFLERQAGVCQVLLTKPQCRREPLLD